LDLNFVGRHLLTPVNSTNAPYVTQKIKEQMTGTSVTVVLIGKDTAKSSWVSDEIQWSLDKDRPNGLVGIKLSPDAQVPDGLVDAGAEILDWNEPADVHHFGAAIDQAALAAGRIPALQGQSGGGSSCAR
jgi:hypothetical protein